MTRTYARTYQAAGGGAALITHDVKDLHTATLKAMSYPMSYPCAAHKDGADHCCFVAYTVALNGVPAEGSLSGSHCNNVYSLYYSLHSLHYMLP